MPIFKKPMHFQCIVVQFLTHPLSLSVRSLGIRLIIREIPELRFAASGMTLLGENPAANQDKFSSLPVTLITQVGGPENHGG
jgi:hypothetical protein